MSANMSGSAGEVSCGSASSSGTGNPKSGGRCVNVNGWPSSGCGPFQTLPARLYVLSSGVNWYSFRCRPVSSSFLASGNFLFEMSGIGNRAFMSTPVRTSKARA